MPTSKLPLDEEFVLTLSDNEDLLISDLGSEEESALTPRPAPPAKKRKRGDEVGDVRTEKVKKQKKKVESEEESEGEERGKQDGAIDPDFEFDFAGNASTGIIEDFDGWDEASTLQKRGDRKGVDVDEIIARRAEKKAKEVKNHENHGQDEDVFNGLDDETLEQDNDTEENESEDEDAEETFGFDDDELLAEDAFGGAVQSDAEEDVGENGPSDEESADNISGEGGSDSDSDSESAASPTAHPDDLVLDDDNDSQTTTSDVEENAKRAAFFAPDPESQANGTKPTSTNISQHGFSQFSLSRPLLRALGTLSFNAPTPIQTRTIPLALQGLDLVGSAVTGSGKTAAFLLPIFERLLYRPRRIPTTRVAILMPTRELAVQCHSVAVALARFTDITFAQLVGGFSLREQEAILKRRPDVVIATPGRFIDHMRNSASFSVETLEILVLDEADRMLEDGFADELNEILRTIPRGRQTMLFSATMTESVDKLVRVGMNRPVRVSVDAKKATTTGLVQEFVRLRPGREDKRLASLALLCQNSFTERTIVFFRQKKEAHRVRVVFGLLGLKAGELHGSMSQEQRIAAVSAFRDGRTSHLLATDLASRGLDIKNVAGVINYEAPQSHEIYVHRVGRTARAGREGRACTIAAEPDRRVVKAAVKSARAQGAKVVSRALEVSEVDAMHKRIQEMDDEITDILREEAEEKQMLQAETQLTRGENIVRHEKEIMGRPKRTWFESEKEKRAARKTGRVELNGPDVKVKPGKGGKLSGKDKKRLDDRRERAEGKIWRKGKGSEEASKAERARGKTKGKSGKSGGIKKMKKMKKGPGGVGGKKGKGRR